MRKLAMAVVALASWCVLAAPAQAATRIGAGCDLAVAGAHDAAAFLSFDTALRAAALRPDAAALSALVDVPLRVNRADGTHATLASAAAVRAIGPTLLPVVRAAVAATPVAKLFCNDNGVMYGEGQVWANLVKVAGGIEQFRITSVNLPKAIPEAMTSPYAFRLDVTLSPKASARLHALHEGIVVSAAYYGDPKPDAVQHGDEVGHIDLGVQDLSLPGRAGAAVISGAAIHKARLAWIQGPVKVNVNVYSARLSGPDNLLACDFIDGDVAAVIKVQPVVLHCGLISEHPATAMKP